MYTQATLKSHTPKSSITGPLILRDLKAEGLDFNKNRLPDLRTPTKAGRGRESGYGSFIRKINGTASLCTNRLYILIAVPEISAVSENQRNCSVISNHSHNQEMFTQEDGPFCGLILWQLVRSESTVTRVTEEDYAWSIDIYLKDAVEEKDHVSPQLRFDTFATTNARRKKRRRTERKARVGDTGVDFKCWRDPLRARTLTPTTALLL